MNLRWRTLPAALGLPVLLWPGPSHAHSTTVELTPQWLHRASSWTELDTTGQRLLHEQGQLDGLGIRAQWNRSWGALLVGAQRTGGNRHYDGTTSSGAAIQTDTHVQENAFTGKISVQLTPEWSGTTSLESVRLERRLQGVGLVQGYTERWRWTIAMVGIEAARSTRCGHWLAGVEVGAPLDTVMRTKLPGSDEISLRPHSRPAWRMRLENRSTTQQWGAISTSLYAGIIVQEQSWGASDAVPVFASGQLRGSALQPRTRQHDQMLYIGLSGHW